MGEEQEVMSISQVTSQIIDDACSGMENFDIGSKEYNTAVNVAFKGLKIISDENKIGVDIENGDKNRDLEKQKLESSEKLKKLDIEAREKDREVELAKIKSAEKIKKLEIEEREKDREIERLKIESNERIRLAEIDSNERTRCHDIFISNLISGSKLASDVFGLFVKIFEIRTELKNDREARQFKSVSDKEAREFKSVCDKQNREFLEDMNLKSYIFEESNSARSTASKRNEKLLDSFSKELGRKESTNKDI